MAGSDEFKESLSKAAQREQTREEIGNDPERLAERISVVDRDKYDFGDFTDKQINMALKGKSFGDEDYARLTGKSLGSDTPKEENPANDIGDSAEPVRTSPVLETGLMPMPTVGSNSPDGDSFFSGDGVNQNVGKRGDMNISLSGNTFGDGASIGNDNSMTIGSNMFGSALSLPRRRMAEEGAFTGLRLS